jgi:endonuclease/exonuclease/phosphatase family metal-dependent hydrolase
VETNITPRHFAHSPSVRGAINLDTLFDHVNVDGIESFSRHKIQIMNTCGIIACVVGGIIGVILIVLLIMTCCRNTPNLPQQKRTNVANLSIAITPVETSLSTQPHRSELNQAHYQHAREPIYPPSPAYIPYTQEYVYTHNDDVIYPPMIYPDVESTPKYRQIPDSYEPTNQSPYLTERDDWWKHKESQESPKNMTPFWNPIQQAEVIEDVAPRRTIPPRKRFYAPPPPPSRPLRRRRVLHTSPGIIIGSYNLRIDVDPAPHDWKNRRSHVVDVLKNMNASIVGLQEVKNSMKRYLKSRFPTFEFVGAGRSRTSDESAPIMIDTSVWTIHRSDTFVMTQNQPTKCNRGVCSAATMFRNIGVAKHPRLVTWARLKNISGFTVDVYNTHFPLDDAIQHECAKILVKFIENTSKEIPVLMCGDFNNYHHPKSEVAPIAHFMKNGFMQDAHALADTPTFGSFTSIFTDRHKLDFIFYRGLESPTCAAVDDTVYSSERFRPSDHSAVVATFL